MKKLAETLRTLVRAEEAVITELKRLYPIDMPIRVWLMHGQINPSKGRVIAHEGGPYGLVVVRLDSRAQDVRRISANDILPQE